MTSSDLRIPAPECFQRPMEIPHMLLLGPGPTNLTQRVVTALSSSMLSLMQPEFTKIMDDVKDGLRYLFQTNSKDVFCITGTGTVGIEGVVTNIIEPGEVFLICKNGFWGQQAATMASRHDAKIRLLEKPLGEAFSVKEIEKGLAEHRPVLLFVTHVESSTGVVQPCIPEIGKLCEKYGTILAVDTVPSLGGVPFYMDEWGVDIAFTGTQKVLNCPPSLAPVAISEKAMRKIRNRKIPPRSFYFDFALLADHWGCNGDKSFHHTTPTNSVYALRESLAHFAEQGLENIWLRHSECAKRLQDGIQQLGLELFVKEPLHRAPTITTIKVPPGIHWKPLTTYLVKNFRVEIVGGLGPSDELVWRVGLLGENCTKENVDFLLRVLGETLSKQNGFEK